MGQASAHAMKTSTTSTVLPCSPDDFWGVFLDADYLHALYVEELDSRAFEVIEIGDTFRKLRIVPKMKLPGPVAKLIGDSFAYEDHGTLERAKNEWTWQMVQPANLDSKRKPRKNVVTMRGTIRVEALDGEQCRRTDEFTVEAKIFGLGGRIESTIESELQRGRAKEFAFLDAWLRRPADPLG